MKKLTLLFSTLFIAFLANAQTVTSTATVATPVDISKVLEFKEAAHNFGKIPSGKPVEFDVSIKNIGTEPIKIENVKVGCGCTTPKYDATKSFSPGETFKITLGYSNAVEGPFEKYADVYFSNGTSKQIKFSGESYKAETAAPANGAVQKMKNGGSN